MNVKAARSFLPIDRTPPVELQLWECGDNPTDYGVHRWTETSASTVMAEYAARGNPLAMDIEHGGTVDENGDARPMAGYAHLELRGGAPWLTFEWSKVGAEEIQTGQRRYLSPEYGVDTETKEIQLLVRVSLVAEPGTHHANQLARASDKALLGRVAAGANMDPIVRLDTLERDTLIERHGAKMAEPILAWAKKQSPAVLRTFCAALPLDRTRASGRGPRRPGWSPHALQGMELKIFAAKMGGMAERFVERLEAGEFDRPQEVVTSASVGPIVEDGTLRVRGNLLTWQRARRAEATKTVHALMSGGK